MHLSPVWLQQSEPEQLADLHAEHLSLEWDSPSCVLTKGHCCRSHTCSHHFLCDKLPPNKTNFLFNTEQGGKDSHLRGVDDVSTTSRQPDLCNFEGMCPHCERDSCTITGDQVTIRQKKRFLRSGSLTCYHVQQASSQETNE